MSGPARFGHVAIIGAPNAGKSTLLNHVTGMKLAIVTPKAQTTRNRILGVAMHGATQMAFVDTPGIFRAKERFEKAMVAAALSGARDADAIVLMVDAMRGVTPEVEMIVEQLARMGLPKLLVLNKVDKVKKEVLPPLAADLFGRGGFEACFMISAQKGDGVDALLAHLAGLLPEGPWHFPEDQVTDVPMRELAAEITREKLFFRLQQELPYGAAVEAESWEEKADGSIRIGQVIYVQSEGQKKIVIGAKGAMLKAIGQAARADIGRLAGVTVHLSLFVKVSKDWKDNPGFYSRIGLEYK